MAPGWTSTSRASFGGREQGQQDARRADIHACPSSTRGPVNAGTVAAVAEHLDSSGGCEAPSMHLASGNACAPLAHPGSRRVRRRRRCAGDGHSGLRDRGGRERRDDAAAHDAGHVSTCETIGRTGPTTSCRLFAFCGHADFELECSVGISCVCRERRADDAGAAVDGGEQTVAYEPIFCESPEASSADLRAAFAAATQACGWTR